MNAMRHLSVSESEIADRVQAYSDQALNTTTAVRDRLAGAVEQGADWAARKTRAVDATSREAFASVCSSISARPLWAVGIAVVAGLLLARVVSRD